MRASVEGQSKLGDKRMILKRIGKGKTERISTNEILRKKKNPLPR